MEVLAEFPRLKDGCSGQTGRRGGGFWGAKDPKSDAPQKNIGRLEKKFAVSSGALPVVARHGHSRRYRHRLQSGQVCCHYEVILQPLYDKEITSKNKHRVLEY
jgi:hypothetical protein